MIRLSSLRYRIALTIFVLEAIMVVSVVLITLSYSRGQATEHIQQMDDVTLELLVFQARSALLSTDFDELQQYTVKLSEDPHISRILISDNNKRIVISSDFNLVGHQVPKLSQRNALYWRTQTVGNLGKVYIEFNNSGLNATSRRAKRLGFSIALAGMLITALAGLLLGHYLTRKLRVLTDAVNRFRHGDTSIHTRFHGNDEVSQLGNRFEDMKTQIDNYIQSLEHGRQTLELKVEERTRELAELNRQLHHLSLTDELTGINNRRLFNERLEQECKTASRSGAWLGLALIDIDHFKAYNDYYGHLRGDEVLRIVAHRMQQNLPRGADFLARYGGEEFVVIIPATDKQGGLQLARSLGDSIRELAIPNLGIGPDTVITISIGVTCTRSQERLNPAILTREADDALYDAKRSGRDCVILYQEERHHRSA
jgi:diguanylate cyclase (GGDEF)-like protein